MYDKIHYNKKKIIKKKKRHKPGGVFCFVLRDQMYGRWGLGSLTMD